MRSWRTFRQSFTCDIDTSPEVEVEELGTVLDDDLEYPGPPGRSSPSCPGTGDTTGASSWVRAPPSPAASGECR